jgi:hypothetical protein
VHSTRGPVVRTFADAERTIAGIDDGLTAEGEIRDDRVLAGLRLAQQNGDAERSAEAERQGAANVKGH